MRVALGSDERTPLTDAVARDLAERGYDVRLVGPAAGEAPGEGAPGEDSKQWAQVGREVGELVAAGECDSAVLFCWTGTGASIAANKVAGARAALCTDAATASGARKWNDANVLVMGLRLTSPEVAREMLDAWFATEPDPSEAANIARLEV
jgi:ribose 5-phosphate isomerase B